MFYSPLPTESRWFLHKAYENSVANGSSTYVYFDGATSDGTDGLADEVHVDLGGILLELGQDLCDVALGGETDHDVQLLQLDVDRVVVLDEEHFHLFFQDVWSGGRERD